MSNNSSTGGYLLPIPGQNPGVGNLTFEQFLQSVFVGVSGLPGGLVRPKWQLDPPKQPPVHVNWLAIGLSETDADVFAYTGSLSGSDPNVLMRMEELTVQATFYGPDAYDFASITRDGFQLPQNLEALGRAKMTFAYTDRMMRVPDVVNERWVNRWELGVHLRRQIVRSYPVLTFLSGNGILSVNNEGDGVTDQSIPVEEQ